jgi:hypothetical protein
MYYWGLNQEKKHVDNIIEEGVSLYYVNGVKYEKIELESYENKGFTYATFFNDSYKKTAMNMFCNFHSKSDHLDWSKFTYYKEEGGQVYKTMNLYKKELKLKYKECSKIDEVKTVNPKIISVDVELAYMFFCEKNKEGCGGFLVDRNKDTIFSPFIMEDRTGDYTNSIDYLDEVGNIINLKFTEKQKIVEIYKNGINYKIVKIGKIKLLYRNLIKGQIPVYVSNSFPKFIINTSGTVRKNYPTNVTVTKIEGQDFLFSVKNIKEIILPCLMKNKKFKENYKGIFKNEDFKLNRMSDPGTPLEEFYYMIKFYNNYCQ